MEVCRKRGAHSEDGVFAFLSYLHPFHVALHSVHRRLLFGLVLG